jgi:hypothetical protein
MPELYDNFKQKIKDIEITPENLITILTCAMEVVELSKLKGTEQKDAALKLMTDMLTESTLDEDIKKNYLDMVKSGMVANAVDIIVDATKGKLYVNKHVKKVNAIFKQIKIVINTLSGCFKK